jgi:hypothetical protein
MPEPEEWIAANGPRLVSDDPDDTAILDTVLDDPGLSLAAKGLYALVILRQGQPFNPYEDAFEDVGTIRAAVEELVSAGLVSRVPKA